MPCQWSSSDLPWVLRIWESNFYSQPFFPIHSFLLSFKASLGAGSLTLMLARLHTDFQNTDPAHLFVWITVINKKVYSGRSYFNSYGWLITWIICPSQDLNPFHDMLILSGVLCFIRLATKLHSLRWMFLIFIHINLLPKILACAYDFILLLIKHMIFMIRQIICANSNYGFSVNIVIMINM